MVNLEKEIQIVLEDYEEILWNGKQDLKTVIIGTGLIFLIMLLIWLLVGGFIILVITILIPIYFYLNYLVTNYVVTDKRVLIKSGILGADIKSVYYDQIENLDVKVDLIGKIFGTGGIIIDTGKANSYDLIGGIENPYEVYQKIQSQLSKRKENLYSGKAADNR